MRIQGRTIILRPLLPTDFDVLYQILGRTFTYRNLGRTIRLDQFADFIQDGAYTLMTISYIDKPEGCLGIIDLRDADLANGIAYMSILVDTDNAPDTAGGEAIVLFLRHVFATTPMRKIYAQSTQNSLPWLHDTQNPVRGMRLEGLLRGHLLVGGQAKDIYQFAFWRQEFLKETEHLARFMTVDRPAIPRGNRPMADWATFLHDLQDRFEFLPYVVRTDGGGLRLVDDLHIDSFLLIEIIVWMEEHYGLTVDDERIVHVENLQQLYSLME